MIIGNIANSFVVLNSILYASVIVCSSLSYNSMLYNERNEIANANEIAYENKLISSSVLQDGFCISNKESFWWSSHAWCFYLDTLFCLVLYKCKLDGAKHRLPAVITEPVHSNILAHFGHGAGHFLLGYVFSTEPTNHNRIRIEHIVWLPLFWYGFIQAIHTKITWTKNVFVSVLISLPRKRIPL